MAQKFFGKKINKKYVRPRKNTEIPHKTISKFETVVKEEVVEQPIITVKDNINDLNQENTDMNRLEKVEEILNIKAPKKRVKVEKKDKGLFEREEKVTLITEDNKLILND